MRDNLQYQRMINGNKTIYRVVYDFADAGHCWGFVKGPERAGGKCTKGEIKKLFLPHSGLIGRQVTLLINLKNGSSKNYLGR